MTEKQKQKHITDNAARILTPEQTIDLTDFIEPKTPPRLSWLNAKTHSGFANRKCLPGRKQEHVDAIRENEEKADDKRENQAIDRAENEGMGAGTQRPE